MLRWLDDTKAFGFAGLAHLRFLYGLSIKGIQSSSAQGGIDPDQLA